MQSERTCPALGDYDVVQQKNNFFIPDYLSERTCPALGDYDYSFANRRALPSIAWSERTCPALGDYDTSPVRLLMTCFPGPKGRAPL